MASPKNEGGPDPYPATYHINKSSSDEEGTVIGDEDHNIRQSNRARNPLHLNVTRLDSNQDSDNISRFTKSPSQNREQAHRLDDELKLLQIERQVSNKSRQEREGGEGSSANGADLGKLSTTVRRERARREEVTDDFDAATNPTHERNQIYRPPEHPASAFSKFFKKIHQSNLWLRYLTYIAPVALILAIPLLVGGLVPPSKGQATLYVGHVKLLWFMTWLEIVWLTLWLSRIVAKLLPYPVGLISTLFTNNSKKWRDMVKELELAATLFFWNLAIEVSFLPTMRSHQEGGTGAVYKWQQDMNKVLVSLLVFAALNLIEKIIIQLIAISFHQRTYEDRIETNRFQVASLTKLYAYSKVKLAEVQDSEFDVGSGEDRPVSGTITPGQVLEKAQRNTQKAVAQFGDVAGKIAGDFTGRKVTKSSHPSQVVLTLLGTTGGSQTLARRLYRTFNREETDTVHQEDLVAAFETADECESAFAMFDKDMNGDIEMSELEAVCVEIGRERKAITASLKDLDSVVGKLDNCFMFIVVIVFILVLVSLLSSAAAAGLGSAGTAVLGLAWLLAATAQEFLQSVIFVFIKHPFDVGDRVTIYGNTGGTLTGDDYFVKEIALLYTEFKKMEGHVVQAPNSYLNTLFILNQRRSGGLAEAIPITFKYGTSIDQLDALRQKLLDFVKAEKREYQSNILTELRNIDEAHAINLNIVFFFKSNWQNELLRLQRRNKFVCAMMIAIQECGIEGPRMRYPGQKDSFPLYTQYMPFDPAMRGRGGHPDNPAGDGPPEEPPQNESAFPEFDGANDLPSMSRSRARGPSVVSAMRGQTTHTRPRGESIAQQGRRYDLSLGVSEFSSGDSMGDVFDDGPRHTSIPESFRASPAHSRSRERTSHDIARTTSRATTFGPGMLGRAATDGPRQPGSVHRNRFFSRASRASHDVERAEAGMAGIPEGASPPNERLDPRSGVVGAQAVRLSTNDSIQPEMTEGGRPLFPRASADAPRRSVEFKIQ